MTHILDTALEFAVLHHKGQYRKSFANLPYVVHVVDVATKLRMYGIDDEEVIAAAFLHDTVEDTDVTLDDIELEFGVRVADLVEEMTRPDEYGGNKTKKKEYLKDFAAAKSATAIILKIADRVANCRDYDAAGKSVYAAEYAAQLQPLIDRFDKELAADANAHLHSDVAWLKH